jgi:hypothetical protein
LNTIKESIIYHGQVAYLFYSDIHYGKKFDNPIFGRGYNKDIAHERMMQIAFYTQKYINTENLKGLKIVFGGDLLESILPEGMHPNHLNDMDITGAEQLLYAIESQTFFLNELRKGLGKTFPISITLLSGNHDRIGINRDEDKQRTAAKIAFNIIAKDFSEDKFIEFIIPKTPVSTETIKQENGDLCIISHHGDTGIAKRSGSELVNLYGIGTTGYHLVLNGHWHSSKTTYEHGTNYMTISLPSVCSVDDYILNQNGSNLLPGFILGHQENGGFTFTNKILF